MSNLTNQNQSYFGRIKPHLPLTFLILLFLGLSTYYNVATPMWEAPDETSHFNTIKYIVDNQWVAGPITPYKTSWHHPPLYYILSALVISPIDMTDYFEWRRPNPKSFIIDQTNPVHGPPNIQIHSIREKWPYQNMALAVHIARAINAVFGAITVLGTYLLCRKIFPELRWLALGAASIVAFNPEFLFFSGSVNNEIALAAGFSLALLPIVSILQGNYRPRIFVILGILMAISILFKQSGLVLIGVAGLTIPIAAWQANGWRHLPKWSLWTALPFALITSPYYLRNQLIYGDPFAYAVYESRHPPVTPKPLVDVLNGRFFTRMHESFWGYFGWLNLPYPDLIYTVLWAIYPITFIGICFWFWQARKQNRTTLLIVFILIIAILVAWIFPLRHTLRFGDFGIQGRYLFQMISALGVIIALGFSTILPGKYQAWPLIGLSVGLLCLALWTPGNLIKPAYTFVGDHPTEVESLPFKRADLFADSLELVGYNPWLESEVGPLHIQLYWRTQNPPVADYTVFVHLIGTEENVIGQHDRRPLDGEFPTHLWRQGDIMHTEHSLPFDTNCRTEGCYLVVGFYDWETGERLPVTQGQPFGNAVKLDAFFPHLGVIEP